MSGIIQNVERTYLSERSTEFSSGDTVAVSFKIKEGDKERQQIFQGVVIQKRGSGLGKSFTVRKSSGNSVYVERIFPTHSPLITDIKLLKRGRVRRARLYYLRQRTGKATRVEERR